MKQLAPIVQKQYEKFDTQTPLFNEPVKKNMFPLLRL